MWASAHVARRGTSRREHGQAGGQLQVAEDPLRLGAGKCPDASYLLM